MLGMQESVQCERETSLQCDMQMLFYIGLSGKAARRQCGTCHRIIDSLGMGAMPTTVNPTEKAGLCVKNFARVKNATKSCRTKEGTPKITCVEERCVGIAMSLLTQRNTDLI